ncbi:hypothetical protein J2X31_003585 [Flavobacterium arsenatis]|uniref:Tetratricopeptide repeat protein n=1 Tax=Flavobacterium arsenatis TaxID=1484332 RepID=A0ABU1TUK3_9FLAO|nr:hypothetical protein [Flavobacterium arsenatis]MDR6969552.1 hypothetical protein [Flavobacterium arsenatis]
MLINNKPTNISLDHCKLFADGINYINTSQWILAYTAFAHLYQNTKNKPVALIYNMALCHYYAKEYSKAIAVLSEASTQMAVPSITLYTENQLPSELLIYEYENNHYKRAISETAITLNTNIIKLRIRRLLVDVHLELKNWQEVLRLSTLPEMNKCKNIQEALEIVKSKTTI